MKPVPSSALMAGALLLTCGQVHAGSLGLTGKELLADCASTSEREVAACTGYIQGVFDGRITYMYEHAGSEGPKLTIGLCIYGNDRVTISGIRSAVIKQIRWDLDRYGNSGAGLAVVEAIKAFYPCAGESSSGPLIFKGQEGHP